MRDFTRGQYQLSETQLAYMSGLNHVRYVQGCVTWRICNTKTEVSVFCISEGQDIEEFREGDFEDMFDIFDRANLIFETEKHWVRGEYPVSQKKVPGSVTGNYMVRWGANTFTGEIELYLDVYVDGECVEDVLKPEQDEYGAFDLAMCLITEVFDHEKEEEE